MQGIFLSRAIVLAQKSSEKQKVISHILGRQTILGCIACKIIPSVTLHEGLLANDLSLPRRISPVVFFPPSAEKTAEDLGTNFRLHSK